MYIICMLNVYIISIIYIGIYVYIICMYSVCLDHAFRGEERKVVGIRVAQSTGGVWREGKCRYSRSELLYIGGGKGREP